MVGQLAVVLLRHRRVEAAQARFDVRDRNRELHGRERCGERRVDVTHDDDERGLVAPRAPPATPMSARAVCSAWLPEPTARVDVRGRQLELAR